MWYAVHTCPNLEHGSTSEKSLRWQRFIAVDLQHKFSAQAWVLFYDWYMYVNMYFFRGIFVDIGTTFRDSKPLLLLLLILLFTRTAEEQLGSFASQNKLLIRSCVSLLGLVVLRVILQSTGARLTVNNNVTNKAQSYSWCNSASISNRPRRVFSLGVFNWLGNKVSRYHHSHINTCIGEQIIGKCGLGIPAAVLVRKNSLEY